MKCGTLALITCVLPTLHILLGILKSRHDVLEKKCYSVDLKIPDFLANRREKVDESTNFGLFVVSKQNAKQIQNTQEIKRTLFNKTERDKTCKFSM